MILAGDIGATKTRLALYPEGPGRAEPSAERVYSSRDFPGLQSITRDFLQATGATVACACFGVAGPVKDGRSATTNLPWIIDARDLARALRLPHVALLNDLETSAYGLTALRPEEIAVLREGPPGAAGNRALIAAGTGLGEAGLFWDGRTHRPFATEGGHSSFAPADETQIELLLYLQRRHGQVSWERVLSGPGLVNIYSFLRDSGRGEEPDWLAQEMSEGEPAAVISTAALAERSELCSRTLALFVSLYGAEAGNLALKTMAAGGVYVGGGIAPKILPRLRGPAFIEAFLAKGRMRPLLEAMPVRVVLNDRLAILGAARYAFLETTAG